MNGWIVEDANHGDLQFDNALAGDAMLSLYEATSDGKYRQGAIRAADWAVQQPIVVNWNYNAFSVFFLADAYRVTGQRRFLESAKQKARFGIEPGQLRSGPHAGHWVTPTTPA